MKQCKFIYLVTLLSLLTIAAVSRLKRTVQINIQIESLYPPEADVKLLFSVSARVA